jgi:adenosine deaminase
VTSHLHLHLEPNERKRRQLGHISSTSDINAATFFKAHSVDGPDRLPVTLGDLRLFFEDLHEEQRSQGVEYVEVRFSPRRFAQAAGIAALLNLVSALALDCSSPVVRLILLINRDSPVSYIKLLEHEIGNGLPKAFVGIDLAGDERRYPDVTQFITCFDLARCAGLGITVHAGEFGGPEHIWMALDDLGASRIGHGVAAGRERSLTARLMDDDVLLEMSLTSNVGLGSVGDLASHPLPWLLESGVPVCLNSDVPLHLGTDLADERRLAAALLGANSPAFDFLDECAVRHRFCKDAN